MTRVLIAVFTCLFLLLCQCLPFVAHAQQRSAGPVIVDKQGVMRWAKNNREASFFGVNYTVPFAYGYRSHKALGVDLEKAIDADVYHMARLRLNAFRVHMWDVELSDSVGNLLDNEHLRLFDYLLHRLQQRGIYVMITPIAFWGNGYPERDEKTPGFATVYGKSQSVVNEKAIKAQENYIRQLLAHVNPYTQKTYGTDTNVIAMEINNEPHHSGSKALVTSYVNRLAEAARSTGWRKPIFYNISESPAYADAVVAANVDGHSFQWYPTGLVAGRTLRGNYLTNVDTYSIPFGDTIPAFRNRAKMVYEFDAGDVLQPIMYPAMSRSFRTAGFQWATQFAWDPMATAYANTEYQTHFLSLPYTPAKAISLMIASEAFHRTPRGVSYGQYPRDSLFGDFRVSYRNGLSELNARESFFYSGNTSTTPRVEKELRQLAGVGSSPVVEYEGTGAYFLDKLGAGLWRLEVMPDAVLLRDPFAKASPKKEVVRLQWNSNKMLIRLAELGQAFTIRSVSDHMTIRAVNGSFSIKPGTYLVSGGNPDSRAVPERWGSLGTREFYAPQPQFLEPFLSHTPLPETTEGKPFMLEISVVGIDTSARIDVEFRHTGNHWKTVRMDRKTAVRYEVKVPVEMLRRGTIEYRFILRTAKDGITLFPGAEKQDPYAWDAFHEERYQTVVKGPNVPLILFNPATDMRILNAYNPDWRTASVEWVTTVNTGDPVYRGVIREHSKAEGLGWHLFIGDRLRPGFDTNGSFGVVVTARSINGSTPLRLSFLSRDGLSYSSSIELDTVFRQYRLPLSSFQPAGSLLLPRPYPGFLPLRFPTASGSALKVEEFDKLEVYFPKKEGGGSAGVEIGRVLLERTQ